MNTLVDTKNQVLEAAKRLFKRQGSIAPLEVLVRASLLHPVQLEEWKAGKIPYLEYFFEKDLHKIRYLMRWLHNWALQKGLKPQEMTYFTKGNSLPQKPLDFTKNGRPQTELLYRTHYTAPYLPQQKKHPPAPLPPTKPAILMLPNNAQCAQCQKSLIRGSLYCRAETQSYCLSCGDNLISPFAKFEESYG